VTVEIHGVGAGLCGVGRAPDGRVAFVPGALPGERVEAEPQKQSERFLHARLIEVLSPASERTIPPCGAFGRCGGCAAQHMNYDATLRHKRQIVVDALQRIGGIAAPDVRPVIGMEAPWRYRNKAEYHIRRTADGYEIGALEAESHALVPLDDCLLQHPASIRAMREVRAWLNEDGAPDVQYLVTRVNTDGRLMTILCGSGRINRIDALADRLFANIPEMHALYACELARRPAHALDGTCRFVRGEDSFYDELLGLRFKLSPQSFFQVNRTQAEHLYEQAIAAANLTGNETVIDAYCGAGTISLAMAKSAGRVIGLEIHPAAVRDARENAQLNGLSDKAEFIEGDAKAALADLVKQGVHADVLIVDPPRKGVDPALIGAALRANPSRVVYVSCNPATLARDVKGFVQDGRYRFEYAQPVDLFCWTEHIECVALLSRT